MKYISIYLFISVAILIVVVDPLLKKKVNNRVSKLLLSKKYDEIDALLKKKYIKIIMSPFELDYIEYSKQLVMRNNTKILEMTEKLMSKNISKKRKIVILKSSFEYGISNENEKISTYCYKQLEQYLSEEEMIDYDIPYNIYIQKGSKYLDDYLEEYQSADEDNKATLAVVIAVMYHNLKDYQKEQQYKEIYQKRYLNN